jgi:hypothetical protein
MLDDTERMKPQTTSDEAKKDARPRDQSSIPFPYFDLETATDVGRKLHEHGGVPCDRDQLAGLLGQKPTSGSFGLKIGAARLFGLIEGAQGKFQLTQLGFAILDDDDIRVREAKVTAFLNVPLYRRAFDEFRGKMLPPRPFGLEQAFVEFGVAPKQKAPARLAFDRSARFAGFFDTAGENRLVSPVIGQSSSSAVETKPREPEDIPIEPTKPSRKLHAFIEGLLDELPSPHQDWAVADRVKWLDAASRIFALIYKGSGEIKVTEVPERGAREKPEQG